MSSSDTDDSDTRAAKQREAVRLKQREHMIHTQQLSSERNVNAAKRREEYEQRIMEQNKFYKLEDVVTFERNEKGPHMPQFVKKENPNSRSVIQFFKEWPLVPIFMGVTVFAFGNGMRYLKRKDSLSQQKMMRLRVLAQGAALVAMTYASYSIVAKREEAKRAAVKLSD